MKTPYGFVWLMLLIIVLVMLAVSGGAYWYEHQKTAPMQVENSVEKYSISKGDKLGAMTVVSVAPFNSGQYSDDPESMKIGPENVKLVLVGPIEVTGTYEVVHSEIGFDGYCMTNFDAPSLSRLPSLPGGNALSGFFCFRNEKKVIAELGEDAKTVTVEIDNYELNRYPSEVVDWTNLVNVQR
jgi:hypothetical protein